MCNLKKIVINISLIFLLSSTVIADDIGFLTIKNRIQVDVVNQILPLAHARFENRFLVSFNESEQNLLRQSGIEFEIFLTDINISDYSIVIPPDKPLESTFRLEKLADIKMLGNNLYLTDLSQSASLATAEESGYDFISLDETDIRFSYLPESISNLVEVQDYPTDSLADLISLDSIIAFNTRLEAFRTRYLLSDSIDAARDWIVQKFLDWGYTDVTTPTFVWGGQTHYNVMAVKLGYAEPDQVIVIGGHYDSITYGQPLGPMLFAPGSDDNGSGTTVTLELARIFANIPTRKTIIFMPFSAEEVGLIGSRAAAKSFVDDTTKLEVMYNFDMVGFTTDAIWDINLTSGSNDAYVQVSIAAAERVTSLVPVQVGLSGSSDHWSFHEQGFNICYAAEGDFNTLGWHTELDLTSRMNFPYIAEVVKMSAAALGVVSNSGSPTNIESVVDMGDGQSLQVNWENCSVENIYTLFYGTTPGVYTDSIVVPSGSCSYVVNGLTEGVRYYFSVAVTIIDGYPSIYATIENGMPLTIPRPPVNMNANPELNSIRITWQKNSEADLSHYRIYRNDGSSLELYKDNLRDTFFVDTNVISQKEYSYIVTSVDLDFNESNNSNKSTSHAATFDSGILLVDEIAAGGLFPLQSELIVYFDSIFGSQPFQLYEMNGVSDQLQESFIGQYSSIFYFDDDFSAKLFPFNKIPLTWYSTFQNNMMLAGFRTLAFTLSSPIPQDHFIYEEFGLVSYEEHDPFDFAGAVGENGFPSIQVDLTNPLGNYLPFIPNLVPRSGAQVIYRYDSATDDQSIEGAPCGILYETAHGKRVLLAFPLYFLTDESAKNIMNHLFALFGETITQLPGDLDNSNVINIADLVFMVDYMFRTNIPPLDINTTDVNGSCQNNVTDLVYFVNYLFGVPTGPAPVPGCIR